MHETLQIDTKANKQTKYDEVIRVVASLIESESNLIANLANISAVLAEVFKFWWVGFYLVDTVSSGDDENAKQLVLGPFQVNCKYIPRA